MAGGIGLAPLRPALLTALAARERYGRITVLIGSRSPAEIAFTDELDSWRAAGADVRVTVDRAEGAGAGTSASSPSSSTRWISTRRRRSRSSADPR